MAFHGYPKLLKNSDSVPGPKYDVPTTVGKDARSFSIRARIEPSVKNLPTAPYQAIPSRVGDAPKWSFGGRTSLKPLAPTPGPAYLPPAFGKDAPASSFHGKIGPIKKKGDGDAAGPGPGQYPVGSDIGQGRKWTVKARNFPPGEAGFPAGPGPGRYLPNFMDRPGMRSIHGRIPDPKDKEQKAPYVDIGSTVGDGPKWTIGRKETLALGPGLE
jgi:hypothetical protein